MSIMLYSEAKEMFSEATPEKPVFVHVACYDRFDEDREPGEKPWTEFDSAAIGFLSDPSGVSCVRLAVIDEGPKTESVSDFVEHPVFGDYFSIEPELLVVSEVKAPHKVNPLYESFQQLHADGGYLVYGCLYAEQPSFMNGLKYYQPLEGTASVWDLSDESVAGTKVSSTDDAFRWLLNQHPAYLEGVTILQNCPSGEWLRMAPPAGFFGYPEGSYETYQNRMEYARQAAEEWGVELGSEKAEDVLAKLAKPEPAVEVKPVEQPKVEEPKVEEKKSEVQTEVPAKQVEQPVAAQPVVPVAPQPPVKKPGPRQLPPMPEARTATGGEEYQAQ